MTGLGLGFFEFQFLGAHGFREACFAARNRRVHGRLQRPATVPESLKSALPQVKLIIVWAASVVKYSPPSSYP